MARRPLRIERNVPMAMNRNTQKPKSAPAKSSKPALPERKPGGSTTPMKAKSSNRSAKPGHK